jgi:hypothetical protein
VTEHEVIDLLQHRRMLARIDYNAGIVSAWTEALSDVDPVHAMDALKAMVHRSETDISVPKIRAEIRNIKRGQDGPTPPAPRDTGCACQPPQHGLPNGSICEMHRQRGLDAIARIRNERTGRLKGEVRSI